MTSERNPTPGEELESTFALGLLAATHGACYFPPKTTTAGQGLEGDPTIEEVSTVSETIHSLVGQGPLGIHAALVHERVFPIRDGSFYAFWSGIPLHAVLCGGLYTRSGDFLGYVKPTSARTSSPASLGPYEGHIIELADDSTPSSRAWYFDGIVIRGWGAFIIRDVFASMTVDVLLEEQTVTSAVQPNWLNVYFQAENGRTFALEDHDAAGEWGSAINCQIITLGSTNKPSSMTTDHLIWAQDSSTVPSGNQNYTFIGPTVQADLAHVSAVLLKRLRTQRRLPGQGAFQSPDGVQQTPALSYNISRLMNRYRRQAGPQLVPRR